MKNFTLSANGINSDPATVWAYDTDNNSFYVWIRKNDRDYWWSESGNIPIKFREIVSERF